MGGSMVIKAASGAINLDLVPGILLELLGQPALRIGSDGPTELLS